MDFIVSIDCLFGFASTSKGVLKAVGVSPPVGLVTHSIFSISNQDLWQPDSEYGILFMLLGAIFL